MTFGKQAVLWGTVAGLLTLGATTTASAATWHQGTPKALRGTYMSKVYRFKGGTKGHSYREKLYVQKDGLPFYSFTYVNHKLWNSSPMMGLARAAKYRKLSAHEYEFVGKYKTTGTVKMRLRTYSHHRLRYTYAKSFKGQRMMTRTTRSLAYVFK